nr:GNAT family N-acetyltransferase [Clostridium transplantifaecale]
MDGKKGYRWAEQIGNTISGSRIEYLSDDDKSDTERLWHSCFPEDSEQFVKYYYSEKTRDNRILVKNDNGLIISMTQLNPYRVRVKGQDVETYYVVGVATEESHRREGHFRDVFMRMMQDMNHEQVPFVFLMPADERIYLPLDFAYISELPVLSLTESAGERLTAMDCRDNEEDCEKAAQYMEQWLAGRYDMYCRRDAAYVSRLIKELESEGGTLQFLINGEQVSGLIAHWGADGKEQRLLYTDGQFTEEIKRKPAIMARVTCAETFLSLFRLREAGKELQIKIKIEDHILDAVNGSYIWKLWDSGSSAARAEAEWHREDGETLCMTPGALIGWLCGYRKLEEIHPELSVELMEKLAQIETVNQAFIDEIV